MLGQGVRFVLAGGTAVVLYVITTTVLANVVGVPFQVALAIGFGVAIAIQFTLYRRFVWAHDEEFALAMHHQAARFLTVAAVNYGLTAASTSVLPRALGVPTEAVYLVTVATLPVINFLVLRQGIFHAEPPAEEEAPIPSTRDRDG